MKVLLLNPSLKQSSVGHYHKSVEKNRGGYPPLGLCYIAAVLRKHGCEVKIHDCDNGNFDPEDFKIRAAGFDPEWVGIYTMTWTFRQAASLAGYLREVLPETRIVAGGPNVASFPEETLRYSDFDYALQGEGENAVVEFLRMLRGEIKPVDVSALIYRENGRIVQNAPPPLIERLDDIPFPARDLLAFNHYFDLFSRHDAFITMVTSRGCPYNCLYCDRKNRMGRKWRSQSAPKIVEEIREAVDQFKIREVMFFDDEFVIDQARIYEFCDALRAQNLKIDWECRARVDQVDAKLLQAMRRAGCYRIRFGFESGSDSILQVLKKGITVEQSQECARIARRAGIEIFGYFMMGCPEETPATAMETIQFAMSLDLDFAIFSKTILIPGSELFEWGVRNGQIAPDHWQRYLRGDDVSGAPAISTEALPESRVDELIRSANKTFYRRLPFVTRRLMKIRSFSQAYRQLQVAKGLLCK